MSVLPIRRFARQSLIDEDYSLSLASSQPVAERQPLGVLVVEDDPLLRWALAETLGLAGHHVIEAWDLAGAERGLRDAVNAIDIVLFDCDLPDLPRRDLLASVRLLAGGRVIVMMIDDPEPATTRDAVAFGVHAVVIKPFEMASIERVLRNACRSPRAK